MKNILLEITDKSFCISDTHFNHKGVTTWEKSRLKSMHNDGMGLYVQGDEAALNDAHTEWIIKRWNRSVKKDDIVIHFGDLAWKGYREIVKRLNGRKILILGNHDKKGLNTYTEFEYVVRGAIRIEEDRVYIEATEDQLYSSVELRISDKEYLLSHYPATTLEHRYRVDADGERIWQTPINERIDKLIKIAKHNKTHYNIHGHTHSTSYNKSDNGWDFINVSLEAIDFKPTRIKDLL